MTNINDESGNGNLGGGVADPAVAVCEGEDNGNGNDNNNNHGLPFLVTHWLANYRGRDAIGGGNYDGRGTGTGRNDDEAAVRRVRRAAAELASAFSALGEFGVTTVPGSLSMSMSMSMMADGGGDRIGGRVPGSYQPYYSSYSASASSSTAGSAVANATYADTKRQWGASCPPDQLSRLVQSSLAATQTVEQQHGRQQQRQPPPQRGGGEDVASAVALLAADPRTNLLHASHERFLRQLNHHHRPDDDGYDASKAAHAGDDNVGGVPNNAGRTVGEAFEVDGGGGDDNNNTNNNRNNNIRSSSNGNAHSADVPAGGDRQEQLGHRRLPSTASTLALQPAIVVRGYRRPAGAGAGGTGGSGTDGPLLLDHARRPPYNVEIDSDATRRNVEACESMRRYFDVRDRFARDERQVRSIRRSLEYQNTALERVRKRRDQLISSNGNGMDPAKRLELMDELKSEQDNCDRVLAQLRQQLAKLEPGHLRDAALLPNAKAAADEAFRGAKFAMSGHRDPLYRQRRTLVPPGTSCSGNRGILNLLARESGMDRYNRTGEPMRAFLPATVAGRHRNVETYRALLANRMSHAVTINAHYMSSVYCMKLDKTGRYFITGADDFLVRVFCLTDYLPHRKEIIQLFTPPVPSSAAADAGESSIRGAVLVCTLRGHAGVINDIAVSSDNCFLATASEDGDCRIWGLRDGRPVAILRGHAGGANMVRPFLYTFTALVLKLRKSGIFL